MAKKITNKIKAQKRTFRFSWSVAGNDGLAPKIILLLLLATLFYNLRGIIFTIKDDLGIMIDPARTPILLSSEEKLRLKVGTLVYDYAEFIKQNTPQNAVILIPPQGFPWPATGNVLYFRYFLYPRLLINGKEKEPGVDLKKEDIDYILLAWGEAGWTEYDFTHGWPKFPFPAKKIIYYKGEPVDIRNDETNRVSKDYNPTDPENYKAWGIIVLDKERL